MSKPNKKPRALVSWNTGERVHKSGKDYDRKKLRRELNREAINRN